MFTRTKTLILGAALTLSTLGGIGAETLTASPASAEAFHSIGCYGKHAHNWVSTEARNVKGVVDPFFAFSGENPDNGILRVSMVQDYDACYYKRDRVKPIWTETCWTWVKDPFATDLDKKLAFHGVWANPRMWSPSNDVQVDPVGYKTKGTQQTQHCSKRHYIDAHKQHWLFEHMTAKEHGANARWDVTGHIDIRPLTDDPTFGIGPKYYHPYQGAHGDVLMR